MRIKGFSLTNVFLLKDNNMSKLKNGDFIFLILFADLRCSSLGFLYRWRKASQNLWLFSLIITNEAIYCCSSNEYSYVQCKIKTTNEWFSGFLISFKQMKTDV